MPDYTASWLTAPPLEPSISSGPAGFGGALPRSAYVAPSPGPPSLVRFERTTPTVHLGRFSWLLVNANTSSTGRPTSTSSSSTMAMAVNASLPTRPWEPDRRTSPPMPTWRSFPESPRGRASHRLVDRSRPELVEYPASISQTDQIREIPDVPVPISEKKVVQPLQRWLEFDISKVLQVLQLSRQCGSHKAFAITGRLGELAKVSHQFAAQRQ